MTPLHVACLRGNIGVVELLLQIPNLQLIHPAKNVKLNI